MTTKEWDELIEQTVQEMEEEDRLDLAAGRIPDNDLELIQAKHDAFCKGEGAFAGKCVDVAKAKKYRVLSRSARWLTEHCESVVGMEETPASQCRPTPWSLWCSQNSLTSDMRNIRFSHRWWLLPTPLSSPETAARFISLSASRMFGRMNAKH